jgi:integrase
MKMAIKSYNLKGKKLFEVYVHGTDLRGKRLQMRKRGVASLRKAEDVEFEFSRELARVKEEDIHLRWSEWFPQYLSIMKTMCAPSTIYSCEKIAAKWINGHWDHKELRKISKIDVHELLYEKMLDAETNMHKRKTVLKIARRIFQMAIDHGKLDKNPCQGMIVKVPEPELRVLSNTEAQLLLQEAKANNHRFYPVWVMALFTGMRSGELFALKWVDVDFESCAIHVSKSWNNKNGLKSTKNQKRRVVPISDELLGFLRKLKLERGREEFVLPRLVDWERGEAARVLRDFCDVIGVTNVKFHDLRATFITNLLSQGESLVRVMAIVGHANMATTNVYLRKAGIELKGGTDKLVYSMPFETEAKVLQMKK